VKFVCINIPEVVVVDARIYASNYEIDFFSIYKNLIGN